MLVLRRLSVVLALLALLAPFSLAFRAAPAPAQPVAPVPPGVRVDLSNEGEDVLGCLFDLGYRPAAGLPGRMIFDDQHSLVVLPADRALCGDMV